MNSKQTLVQLRHPLLLLSGLLILSSVAFFPLSKGSIIADFPEAVIPLGISLGIAIYSVRLLQEDYEVNRVKRIAMTGWTGAIVASVSIWALREYFQHELGVTVLFDGALTVVSVGSGIGLFIGAHVIHEHRSVDQTNRDRLLVETVWTNGPQPNPILTTITTQIAELEGVESVELEPLYEHVDPDVFTKLRAQDESQWQLSFYTDVYEIRVSSQGTVSIYDTINLDDEYDIVLSPEEE